MTKSEQPQYRIKEPAGLSPRIEWLRNYYFKGVARPWNNEFTSWTTGTPWDLQYNELSYYIVPETYTFLQTFRSSFNQTARKVKLPLDFWQKSLPERRAWFNKEVMVNYLPREILPGDLLAGARFNIHTSMCLNKKEARKRDKMIYGKKGARTLMKKFHDHGYGNAGATSGHILPDHAHVLRTGWQGVHEDLKKKYAALSGKDAQGEKGAQLRAMTTAATMPRDLALQYARLCTELADTEEDLARKQELRTMARNLKHVSWYPPVDFWQAMQALWLNHMLIMSDENYPGAGVSFGNFDRIMLPYWRKSIADGMDREFGKEIMKCFWVHANTVYDGMIRTGGNQGITAGFGQLFTLSGAGPGGKDMTNELTWAVLEVIDEMSPMLEPKPNIRIHKNTPNELLDKIIEMIESSQGAPFILNFDERSMAGMRLEAEKAGLARLINETNVHEYAPVGCLENTMVGNDRSGTVDNNLNLLKAVELALTGGEDLLRYIDPVTMKADPVVRDGPATPDPRTFKTFDEFYDAFAAQMKYIVTRCVETYELSEAVRAKFNPTPYLSCLVRGCARKALDVTAGGAEINFTTLEAVTFATTVDSLLAIEYLVFDKKECTMDELIKALEDNWVGHEILQAKARYKAPKYGREEDRADKMAKKVMDLWCAETWKHATVSTNRRYRPGMLSWNYWAGDGYIMAASADGRPKGKFLSNAICPSNGADSKGPTSNTNSVGKVLGGKSGNGDRGKHLNCLPNGASHTITFNPSIIADPVHKEKFKAFLRAYCENGGSALQINMLDPAMLADAQKNPQEYRNLLVRVTGYNAYFTSIGRELQNEIIERLSHCRI